MLNLKGLNRFCIRIWVGSISMRPMSERLLIMVFIQSMSRKGNCIDNGATEQVFGHLKDEFFRGQDWQTFESFKVDLDAYIMHWNTVRRQVKLRA